MTPEDQLGIAPQPSEVTELFNGEGKACWDDWIDQFKHIANVIEWDDIKIEIPPSMSFGRAAAAVYKRLSAETRGDLRQTVKALEEQFDHPVEESFIELS